MCNKYQCYSDICTYVFLILYLEALILGSFARILQMLYKYKFNLIFIQKFEMLISKMKIYSGKLHPDDKLAFI